MQCSPGPSKGRSRLRCSSEASSVTQEQACLTPLPDRPLADSSGRGTPWQGQRWVQTPHWAICHSHSCGGRPRSAFPWPPPSTLAPSALLLHISWEWLSCGVHGSLPQGKSGRQRSVGHPIVPVTVVSLLALALPLSCYAPSALTSASSCGLPGMCPGPSFLSCLCLVALSGPQRPSHPVAVSAALSVWLEQRPLAVGVTPTRVPWPASKSSQRGQMET